MCFHDHWGFAHKDLLVGLTVAAISLPQVRAWSLSRDYDRHPNKVPK